MRKIAFLAIVLAAYSPATYAADSTVSAMTAASALGGTELFYCVQGGADRKCTATQVSAFGNTYPVTVAGTTTSGGIPYFSSTTALTSSGLLAANALMVGGGAGAAPATVTTGNGVVTALGITPGTTGSFAKQNGAITNGNCLQWSASGIQDAGAACGTGGSGITIDTTAITGGTASRLLFESATNKVTESSLLSFDSTNGALSVGGATVTTSKPVLDLSQTWNNSAVTFTGLKFNAAGTSDANSASGSRLLDLQIGSSSKLYIDKVGDIYANGAQITRYVSSSRLDIGGSFTDGLIYASASTLGIGANSASAVISTGYLGSAQFRAYKFVIGNGTSDLFLTRGNAATLQLGDADAAAPVAQTLQVQSVVAGTSNTAGTNFTINGSRGTGTGAGGSIIFQVAPAGSTGTSQNALATALTIDSTKAATFTSSVGASSFTASTSISITSGPQLRQSGGLAVIDGNGSRPIYVTSSIAMSTAKYIGFYGTDTVDASIDTLLTRAAAATLQLGAADAAAPVAQTLQVQSVVAGTSNTAGTNFTIAGSKGTGNAAGGSIIFQVAPAGSSGTAVNALATALTIDSTKLATFAAGINVSSTAYGRAWGGLAGASSSIEVNPNDNYIYMSSAAAIAWGSTLFAADTKLYRGAAALVAFGGKTAASPGLKYSSTTLQVRLADDSAYTTIDALLRSQGTAPATAAATGTAGDIRYDSGYIYVCTATDTWKRVAIATW